MGYYNSACVVVSKVLSYGVEDDVGCLKLNLFKALFCLLLSISVSMSAEVDTGPSTTGETAESSVEKENSKKPNILLIGIDTLRSDYLSCYSTGASATPTIDQLASEGILFEEHFSCCPWTAPSFSSIMTGLFPSVHGVMRAVIPEILPDTCSTLAEILRDMGYKTAAFTEGGYLSPVWGIVRGFEISERTFATEKNIEKYYGFWTVLEKNAEKFIDWLRANETLPFFAFFHTYESHYPYDAPESYLDEIPAEDRVTFKDRERLSEIALRIVENEDNYAKKNKNRLVNVSLEEHIELIKFYFQYGIHALQLPEGSKFPRGFLQFDRSDLFSPAIEYVKALYAAEVRYTDAIVGKIINELEELGMMENTLIVFTSDHGEGFFEHGKFGHGFGLYRELLQIPLIIRMPGKKDAGKRISKMSRSIDIAPTIMAYLGGTINEIQGRSLFPYLDDNNNYPEIPSFAEGLARKNKEASTKSIRDRDWCIIVDHDEKEELCFNLSKDAEELNDVSGRKKGFQISKKMFEMLQRLIRENEKRANALGTGANFGGLPSPPETLDDETIDLLLGAGYPPMPLKPTDKKKEPQIDDELQEQLKALGYIE